MQNFRSNYILIAAALIIFFKILTNLSLYTDSYDYALYTDRYERSQYVLNIRATNIISDDDLYSYAGYYYITGGEVSRVNFENPPLGKYLIGISILLFNNQRVIYIFYTLLFLLLIYKMGLLIFKNPVIASMGVFWAVIDPYFTRQMFYPMLDLPMAIFFIIGLYKFIIGRQSKNYLISSLFFGLSMATKFFPALVLILLFLMFYQWVFRRNQFSVFLLSLSLVPIVYSVSYFELFRRVSLVGFLEFQWWMLKWRTANPVVIGNALESIF
ncbi:MAG: glycosyltransferase family 39 protein [Patescibacteria group bacterium]